MTKKLFYNGKIYISFKPLTVAEAMLIDSDTITDYGNLESESDEVERIDLQGKTVIPGFIDSHMHLDELGEYLNSIDLRGVRTIDEMKLRIQSQMSSERWIIGHGWDQELLSEGRWPTSSDIDGVSGQKPMLLSRVDLHSALLNSQGMKESGIIEMSELSPFIERDGQGNPTGIIKEKAFGYVKDLIKKKRTKEYWKKLLTDAISYASKKGVTSIGFVSCSEDIFKLLLEIDKKDLKIRIFVFVNPDFMMKEEFPSYLKDDSMMKIAGVKLFSDGSLGSRTALLSFDYADDRGNRGLAAMSGGDIYSMAKKAESLGLDVATHAIGDKALDTVLGVYARLNFNHRIEHASLIRQDQFDLIKKVGAILVTQPHFVVTDFWILDRVGKQNAKIVHPFKTILRKGIPQAFSTDCPVEPLDPWETVKAAVDRGKERGIELSILSDNEVLSVADSLDIYTRGSAGALRHKRIGTLERGNYADFIVLDREPLNSDLSEISVLETYVGGQRAFLGEPPSTPFSKTKV